MYRILFIGSFSRPYDTEVYIYKTLESLGHQVIKATLEKATIERLKETLLTVDFVLFSKGSFPDSSGDVMGYIKSLGVPTVGWFWDLAWGTIREWMIKKHPLFKADIVFSTDGGHEKEYKQAGINHFVLRQGIFEPEAYIAEPTEPIEDIIFVGSAAHGSNFGWHYRERLIKWLQDTFKKRFGWYGQVSQVRNGDLNQLFANAKIVIGDSVSSPNYWSNRLYETLGRGGFLIFPHIEGIEKEFKPYKDFVPYNFGGFDGLKQKIDYFLTHDKEREAIRLSGFKACKKGHTYTERCKELLTVVSENL